MATQEIELPNVPGEDTKGVPVLEINNVTLDSDDKTDNGQTDQIKSLDPPEDQQSTENTKNGASNPVFMQDEEVIEETQPALTYIDFLPQQTNKDGESEGAEPIYSSFSTLVDQANDWLMKNPEYSLWKCETVVFKEQNDYKIEQDNPLYMESAFGANRYVAGLRLWLVPQMNSSLPVAQIGFTTALPGKQGDDQNIRVSMTTTIQDSIEQLNRQFQKKPLPGVIINIEVVEFRENESSGSLNIDPNRTHWTENGAENIANVQAVRLFFIMGKTEHVKIGFHDELPEVVHTAFATSVRFGPFRNVVRKMGAWLTQQKGIRVVHLQSINAVINMNKEGTSSMDPLQSAFVERSGIETRYAKYLRAFYVVNKSEEKPYAHVKLHTRLFSPIKKEGKLFESFSKTMQRTIKWMDYTRVPPFSVETVKYQVYIGGETLPSLEDKVDKFVRRGTGRYQLSNIRIYFPSEFIEPPPEISPEVDTAAGWGCVIS